MKLLTAFRAAVWGLSLGLLASCGDDPVTPKPGLEIHTFSTRSDTFIRNRFYRLDLPHTELNGRDPAREFIAVASLEVFKLMAPGPLEPNDLAYVAAYVDSTGFRDWNAATIDFTAPHAYGPVWRRLTDLEIILDTDGRLEAIDLRAPVLDADILAVVYAVVDVQGNLIAQVGDRPGSTPPSQDLPGEEDRYFRMKLLKAPVLNNDRHVFGYELRNVYSLGGADLDAAMLHDLRIESLAPGLLHPELNENALSYVRIFGLDTESPAGDPRPDGVVDFHNPRLFDLNRGLLRFPLDFPEPFAAAEVQYAANANDPTFCFANSPFLAGHPAPAFYSPDFLPVDYPQYAYFRIVVETR